MIRPTDMGSWKEVSRPDSDESMIDVATLTVGLNRWEGTSLLLGFEVIVGPGEACVLRLSFNSRFSLARFRGAAKLSIEIGLTTLFFKMPTGEEVKLRGLSRWVLGSLQVQSGGTREGDVRIIYS